ncbi:MAG: aminotransferase class V-fold PLP-dependent enzyme, partial [Clostridia bacterium]|nr:aminotransferase class V-fold PLP-dependent enzyme [Clostridia bacterium]
MIFLDNASTTSLCKSGAENLLKYSEELFYNPSASYSMGFENYKKIQGVKARLAQKLGVEFKNNIIFTGSATEATNLAIFGSYRPNWKKAVFSAGEHPSVYNCALELEARGVKVEFVELTKQGAVDLEKLSAVLDEDVAFLSIMQVSNETGAINNLEKIARLKQQKCKNAIFHV